MKKFLLPALLLLAGCDEQQVLYTSKAKEPIEAPPTNPTAAVVGVPSAANPPSAAMLPEPKVVDFTTVDVGEPTKAVEIRGLRVPVPARYEDVSSNTPMRAAEYRVPPKSGNGEAGELVFFHFGAGQGGDAVANAARWLRQFQPAPGEQSALRRFETDRDVAGLRVTRLTTEGTYAAAAMGPAMAPPPARENWALDALVFEGLPEGNLFIRLTGPRELVQAESAILQKMAAEAVPVAGGAAASGSSAPAGTPPIPDSTQPVEPEGAGVVGLAKVEAPGVAFAVPANWESTPAETSMRALQFQIPGATAGADAEMVVFYFGAGGGGSADENVKRWIGQVSQPDGTPSADRATVQKLQKGQFSVTRVLVEGTYAGSAMGPGAPVPAPRENHALIGIVIEGGPEGPLYIRLTGPVETVRANAPALQLLVESLEAMNRQERE